MRRQRDRWMTRLLLLIALGIGLLWLSGCATSPAREVTGGGVAVWDLEDLSYGAARTDLGELLSAQVVEVLKGRGETVVDRALLLRTLEEQRIGSSRLAEEDTRLQLGRLVGARRMVFGAYQVFGSQLRIDLRMVDVETGRVLKAVRQTAPAGDLPLWLEAARSAAAQL